jgi:spore coat polysaccharide biosynthesis predicted glycosyltransferase SpsG
MEYENKSDIILDKHKGDEKFLNFFENSEQILDKNKRYDVSICLGSADKPLLTKTIPMNYLKNENELMMNCLSMTKSLTTFNHYIISPKIINKKYYVILIPETGAA